MRRMMSVALLIASVLWNACGSAGTATIQGVTWNLATVNGANLPFMTQVNELKIEQLGERLVLLPDGTFTQSGQERRTEGTIVSVQTYTLNGWYTIRGSAAAFGTGMRGPPLTGMVVGDTLTLARAATTYVYVRAGCC